MLQGLPLTLLLSLLSSLLQDAVSLVWIRGSLFTLVVVIVFEGVQRLPRTEANEDHEPNPFRKNDYKLRDQSLFSKHLHDEIQILCHIQVVFFPFPSLIEHHLHQLDSNEEDVIFRSVLGSKSV